MKNEMDELFGNVSDKQAEKIAAEYFTGGREQRDRIFNEVERRINADSFAADEVSGVEVRHSRPYLRIISAAAAFVLVAGAAAGGGYALLSRKGSSTDKIVPAAQISETVEITSEPLTYEATTAAEVPVQLTEADLLAKLNSWSYDDYERINMEYSVVLNNGGTTIHEIIKKDSDTVDESLITTWTHNADYYLADMELYPNTDIDTLVNSYSKNEHYMHKDLAVTIYSNSEMAPQYDAMARENSDFDKPNIFAMSYPERLLEEINNDKYEIREITDGVEYNGRECISARLYCPSESDYLRKVMQQNGQDPAVLFDMDLEELEKIKEELGLSGELTDSDMEKIREKAKEYDWITKENDDSEVVIMVDNETGLIIGAEWASGDESYSMEKLCFNDEAELPEDAQYIKSRIAECKPNCEETALFDLSALEG